MLVKSMDHVDSKTNQNVVNYVWAHYFDTVGVQGYTLVIFGFLASLGQSNEYEGVDSIH